VSLLIPFLHSRSMVTVLRGARQVCGLLRATSRQESDRLKAVRQVPPDDRRSELHPARTFATAAVREQGSISRLLRDDRQGNRLHLTDAGRTTAVYGQFVHRRSGGEAVKAICVFDGDGNEGPSSLARSRHRLAWADLVGSR
jgi:hypothetical protein